VEDITEIILVRFWWLTV